jgi:hypothetical protein
MQRSTRQLAGRLAGVDLSAVLSTASLPATSQTCCSYIFEYIFSLEASLLLLQQHLTRHVLMRQNRGELHTRSAPHGCWLDAWCAQPLLKVTTTKHAATGQPAADSVSCSVVKPMRPQAYHAYVPLKSTQVHGYASGGWQLDGSKKACSVKAPPTSSRLLDNHHMRCKLSIHLAPRIPHTCLSPLRCWHLHGS